MADEKHEKKVKGLPIHVRQAPDMRYTYANNVYFDTSAFDVKMMFGEMRRDSTSVFIRQDTSVTMTWEEAKITAIYLALNVIGHEDTHGPLCLKEGVRPAAVSADEARLPLREFFEVALRRYRDQKKEEEAKESEQPN
ncbi:MAG TPA: DUF3467 domain-containing protein [Candidatus Koribacter sp.]|jgi:hypothetical protein